ncbi:TPA: hypothetical protein DCY67_00940 [Candidatus Acetothermia bacterium]|nr:hypothetical protein [Candidatus Acetothermia bacterium]
MRVVPALDELEPRMKPDHLAIDVSHDNWVGAWKVKEVALTACMRRLLVILNAIAKTGTPWDEARVAS